MFEVDRAPKPYLRRPRRVAGWGRVLLLTGGLLVVSAQLAYGSGGTRYDRVVVGPGDTVWSIAQARYGGDPRSRVDQILRINHLTSPTLIPGEVLRVPADS